MEEEKIILIVLLVLLIFSNALMDLSAQGKLKKPNLNMKNTWRRKWKNGNKSEGEKFFGSSTIFVFVTDFFHLVKMVFILLLASIMTICLNGGILGFFSVAIFWGVVFEIFYRVLGGKK